MIEEDDFGVRIVRIEGAEPEYDVDLVKREISFTFSGDVSDLVTLALDAGQKIATSRLNAVPVIGSTESDL